MYRKRTYRNLIRGTGLVSFQVVVKETDLSVYAVKPLVDITREIILEYRGYIEAHIQRYPDFATILIPWHTPNPVPAIIQDMIAAGEKAGVGPMASVAGVIAEYVGRRLLPYSDEVIIENGGDIFVKKNTPVTVAVFAGKSPLSLKIGLRIDPGGLPIAVATSSGTVGHSLSFGKADAVCVISRSCALADAAATSVGNHVKSKHDIENALEFGKSIPGVAGLLIIIGDKLGAWGDLEIVPIQGKKC